MSVSGCRTFLDMLMICVFWRSKTSSTHVGVTMLRVLDMIFTPTAARYSPIGRWSHSGSELDTRKLNRHFLVLALPPTRSNSMGVSSCPSARTTRPLEITSVPFAEPHTTSTVVVGRRVRRPRRDDGSVKSPENPLTCHYA